MPDEGYLFADFGAWLTATGLTLTDARKDGCKGISRAAGEGYLLTEQAEQWSEALCADMHEIWPEGPRSIVVLEELLTAAFLEDEIVSAEQIDAELAGEKLVPETPPIVEELLEVSASDTTSEELTTEDELLRPDGEEPKVEVDWRAINSQPRRRTRGVITPQIVVEATAAVYGVTPEQIIGRDGKRPIAQARRVAIAACRQLTDHSWPLLAEFFDGRDHTTLMAGVRRMDDDDRAMVVRVVEYVEKALPVLEAGSVIDSIPLAVRVPPQLYDALGAAANDRGLTVDRIVVDALRDFLPRLVPVDEWRITSK